MIFSKKKIKDETGAVMVVEAVFVFPIVIFVVIVLIYLGNMLYQQSKMDAIAMRGAEYLAAIYTSPLLAEEQIPTNSENINIKPYRYLFGDSQAESKAKDYIEKLMKSTGTGLFSGMEMNGYVKTCKINNYVVYQTAAVEIEYSINLIPMKLFDLPTLYSCSNSTATAATDSAEFIRNIDMIIDYSKKYDIPEKIKSTVGAFTGN